MDRRREHVCFSLAVAHLATETNPGLTTGLSLSLGERLASSRRNPQTVYRDMAVPSGWHTSQGFGPLRNRRSPADAAPDNTPACRRERSQGPPVRRL